MRTLNDLKIGEKTTIVEIKDSDISLRLMSMGCIAGEKIVIKFISPLGCPIAFMVNESLIAIRKEEATTIIVK